MTTAISSKSNYFFSLGDIPSLLQQTALKVANFVLSKEGLFIIAATIAIGSVYGIPFGLAACAGATILVTVAKSLANLRSKRSLSSELQTMVGKNFITSAVRKDILQAAGQAKTPYHFRSWVEQSISKKAFTEETAFFILRSYDAENSLATQITDGIRALQKSRRISPSTAYRVYQTYHIIRNDTGFFNNLYRKVLQDLVQHPALPADLKISQNQADNLLVYQQTRWASNHDSDIVPLANQLRKNTYVSTPLPVQGSPNPNYNTQIFVKDCTTFQMAQKLVRRGYHPAILDMANAYQEGGGVRKGSNAQEEIVARQSTLMEGLEAIKNKGGFPIPELGVIVLPGVHFFRKDPQQGYSRLGNSWLAWNKPFTADVIASAAYDCVEGHKPNPYNPWGVGYDRPFLNMQYVANTKEKMRAVCRAAIRNGNDSLVLSAYGCGAFKNNPSLIASLYNEVLSESEFKGKFKMIAFGIIDDRNGKGNVQAFKNRFPTAAPF